MRRHTVIGTLVLFIAALCVGAGCAHEPTTGQLAPVAPREQMTSRQIQAQLDAMPKSNGLFAGEPMGGRVHLTRGKVELGKTSLRISSGQEIEGDGMGTVLVYDGPPGTSAISVYSVAGHGYVLNPKILNLQIVCTNGADTIALDPSCRYLEGMLVENVVVYGGRLNLPGENYFNTLARVNFTRPAGQYVYYSGQGLTLSGVTLDPNARLPAQVLKSNPPKAMVEVHGSVTVEGFSKIEGGYGVPLIAVEDWRGWEGFLKVASAWVEPHALGTLVVATYARVFADSINWSKPETPLALLRGATAYVSALRPDERVAVDETSSVIVSGAATTRPVMTRPAAPTEAR